MEGRTETGTGLPVPEPPQLLQTVKPVPPQERQPKSPSDQREQRQGTRRVPLQVVQRGKAEEMELWWESRKDLKMRAPARTPIPEASWERTIGGDIAES